MTKVPFLMTMGRVVIVFSLVLTLAIPPIVFAYPLTLAPEAIEEAQAYGERRRTSSGGLDDAPWTRRVEVRDTDIPGQTGVIVLSITWHTPFLELARARATRGRPLNGEEVQDILNAAAARATVSVSASVLRTQSRPQDEADARTATLVVQRPGEVVIRPTDVVRTGPNRITGVLQGYFTTFRSVFPHTEGLDPTETVTVIVSWGALRLPVVYELGALQ